MDQESLKRLLLSHTPKTCPLWGLIFIQPCLTRETVVQTNARLCATNKNFSKTMDLVSASGPQRQSLPGPMANALQVEEVDDNAKDVEHYQSAEEYE